MKMGKSIGFTLVELLIVLAILGVLAAISYPSYQKIVINSRRADAQNELIKAQIEQSSYRIINPTYILDPTLIGFPLNHQHYTFSIVSASESTYKIKAVAKESSSQHADEDLCKSLYIDQNNHKTTNGSIENSVCWRE